MVAEHATRRLELVGSSRLGVQQAIENAIEKAGETIRNLDWFEVKAIRGNIDDGRVRWYQVKLGVGLRALDTTDLPRNE